MIQEYLFVETEKIKDQKSLHYNDVNHEIEEIKNSNCLVVKYSKLGENEETAKILSEINDDIIEKYNPTVLTNDCSAYFNRRLFPHFNDFERKLRKLLYLKSALNNDKKAVENINRLETKDFGELFSLLFSDNNFVSSTKSTVNNKTWQFSKSEIIEAIQKIKENTLWNKLFDKGSVSELSTHFSTVKDYRNDVMHAHNISYEKYKSILSLITKINSQMDTEIEKIIGIRENKKDETVQSNYNLNLNTALVAQSIIATQDLNAINQNSSLEKLVAVLAENMKEQNILQASMTEILNLEALKEAQEERELIKKYLLENNLTIEKLNKNEKLNGEESKLIERIKKENENKADNQ